LLKRTREENERLDCFRLCKIAIYAVTPHTAPQFEPAGTTTPEQSPRFQEWPYLGCFALRQRPAIQHSAQGLAFQKLRNEKRRTIALTRVKDSENIGMIQRCDRLRFLFEAM
jgi:hypothetical protein